jgi:hypothetical protein
MRPPTSDVLLALVTALTDMLLEKPRAAITPKNVNRYYGAQP